MICLVRERVGDWVAKHTRTPLPWGEWYQGIGHEKDGELIAGVVFNFHTEADIVMHIAASGQWLTREYAYAIFAYPFLQLKTRRVSAFPRASDEVTRKLVLALGFTHEGTMRHGYADDDAVLYGMLREECRYLESH